MNRKNAGFSFGGVLIFFLTLLIAVTGSIFIYEVVSRRTDGNLTYIVVTVFLVVLFFSVLCSLADIIRRRIMIDRPVERILDATEKIAAGDFSVRLQTKSTGKYDQYESIMENLNTLAEELGKSEILKTDFISNVSHELKTPLSIIQNYATCLQRKDLDEQTRQAYAKTLENAAKRLTALVTDVLKLNKLEHRALPPEKERFRLDEHLAEAALYFEELIERKGLTLDADLEEITVRSSPSLLEIVWNNLLSNAIKFTDQGGISLSVRGRGGNAVVRIADTGAGISADTGKRLFDKFYQGDTSHASEGNGLGLALVKRVIDILGGEISVESELGKGSVFTVTLKAVIEE